MGVTRVATVLAAPRGRVYEALLDPWIGPRWRVPAAMTCEVHEFEPFEGGRVRISLTYDALDRAGKSGGRTDTYHGTFVRLVPDELLVEADEFEADDPALGGEMTITIELTDAVSGGTELVATHTGVPDVVPEADNEAGWREALQRLAGFVEPER
jgi:uncharacterized protein YndB with AHSA1/START domain